MHYAITNLTEAAQGPSQAAVEQRRAAWLAALTRWIAAGVTYIQLREKTLALAEQIALATEGMAVLKGQPSSAGRRPHLLVNGRADLALAARADGVHLTAQAGELQASEVRELFRNAGRNSCRVSVSCHTLPEVQAASAAGADLLLFGPVFEKRVAGELVVPGTGLALLREAVRMARVVPIFALGGVTAANSAACLEAGASGTAGIRLFGEDWPRSLAPSL